jgi:hypothetical protein
MNQSLLEEHKHKARAWFESLRRGLNRCATIYARPSRRWKIHFPTKLLSPTVRPAASFARPGSAPIITALPVAVASWR